MPGNEFERIEKRLARLEDLFKGLLEMVQEILERTRAIDRKG